MLISDITVQPECAAPYHCKLLTAHMGIIKSLMKNDGQTIRPNIMRGNRIQPMHGWLLAAKFYYAILVADRSKAGRRPVADLSQTC